MAIRNHYLNKSSDGSAIITTAVAELVAQQARIVATTAGRGNTYDVKNQVEKLVRFAEVLNEVRS